MTGAEEQAGGGADATSVATTALGVPGTEDVVPTSGGGRDSRPRNLSKAVCFFVEEPDAPLGGADQQGSSNTLENDDEDGILFTVGRYQSLEGGLDDGSDEDGGFSSSMRHVPTAVELSLPWKTTGEEGEARRSCVPQWMVSSDRPVELASPPISPLPRAAVSASFLDELPAAGSATSGGSASSSRAPSRRQSGGQAADAASVEPAATTSAGLVTSVSVPAHVYGLTSAHRTSVRHRGDEGAGAARPLISDQVNSIVPGADDGEDRELTDQDTMV